MIEERWAKESYLSADAILNYWFDGDREKIQAHSAALRNACIVGYVRCVVNCKDDDSVGVLFDRGGRDLLIERKSFEEWVAGSECIVRDPKHKPAHWFDQIFIDNERKDREREEQRIVEESLLVEQKQEQERAAIEDRVRLETEIKLKTEQEFKDRSKKKAVETGPVDRRTYNSYVHLVGALYDTFIKQEHGDSLPDSLEGLIQHFEIHYNGVFGLSRRTLSDGRLEKALREVRSKIKNT